MCSERRWYISDKYSGLHHSCNCELLQCKERAQNSAAIVSMPQEYQARQMTAHCMPCLLGTAREDSLPYDRMSQGTFGGGGGGGLQVLIVFIGHYALLLLEVVLTGANHRVR